MSFLNRSAFEDPTNWMRSEGFNVSEKAAILSTNGAVLAYPKTGGMMSPKRHTLEPGATLFRFGSSTASPQRIYQGSWWVERSQFDKLLAFANQHGVALGMAVRVLCLVPPEWSDMGKLVRVQVAEPLLAMRGLGESVTVDKGDGLGSVELSHANDNPARRLYQLFIPGLREPGIAARAFTFGNVYDLDVDAGARGWLYL